MPRPGWSQVARREDERFHPCPAGRHWGPRGAAGILPFTVRHGRAWVLLTRRSPHVQHGGTWSCSGGAADEGETPWQAAVREASEEISGIDVNRPASPVSTCGSARRSAAGATRRSWWPSRCARRLPRVPRGRWRPRVGDSGLAWVSASRVHVRDLHPRSLAHRQALRERVEAVARLSAR